MEVWWRTAMTAAAVRQFEEMKPELVGEIYSELCNVDQIGISVADDLASFFAEAQMGSKRSRADARC